MTSQIRFVNFQRQYGNMKFEIDAAINRCLVNGDFILRKDLETFEQSLAKFVGTKHAIGVASGTDALILSMKAAGIDEGDEVITVSHTFVATIAAIYHAGATPVLIDVNEFDMVMNTDLIEDAITKNTRAIIPVHLNGHLCDMEPIMDLAEDHNLTVIEDAAQAIGATRDGYRSGATGTAGCFSFYPAKILGCTGDGGAVTTNDDEIAACIRRLRDHCISRPGGGVSCLGYTSRLDNLQAALLNVKMRYLPEWIERRRQIAEHYRKAFDMVFPILPPPSTDGDVYQAFVIRVLAKHRNDLKEYLLQHGIESMIHFPTPPHLSDAVSRVSKLHPLPVTEMLANEILSLPIYPELKDDEVQEIVQTIVEWS